MVYEGHYMDNHYHQQENFDTVIDEEIERPSDMDIVYSEPIVRYVIRKSLYEIEHILD